MAHTDDALLDKVQGLSDIELAILLCLVTEEHCIIQADTDLQNRVALELGLVCSDVFGLRHAVFECTEETTLDEFSNGILVEADEPSFFTPVVDRHREGRMKSRGSSGYGDRKTSQSPDTRKPSSSQRLANLVVIKDLDKASEPVQTQALELVINKRIFTRNAVYPIPKPFVFVALLSTDDSARLTPLLNDHMFLSHKHNSSDPLLNLESQTLSQKLPLKPKPSLLFPPEAISTLSHHQADTHLSPEIRGYIHNIVVFLRTHRAVSSGVSALATRHFNALARALAPLHGLDYVSPSLVGLAARKVYPHRIEIVTPEQERSVQWGSTVEAVRDMLEGVTTEEVIEEVLVAVEVPL